MKKLNCPTAITIGAVALILGAIGPWVTVLGLFGGGPTNSFDVGLIVFGGIGLLLCSAFSGRFMRTMSILISVLRPSTSRRRDPASPTSSRPTPARARASTTPTGTATPAARSVARTAA
jgi:hypothetical protein